MVMNTYSFRAECQYDLSNFLSECDVHGIEVTYHVTTHDTPDIHVEMNTPASFDRIKRTMQFVDNGHVMHETLRNCKLVDNPLTRDYTV